MTSYLRVLQVQTQAEAGGAQRVGEILAKGLRDHGHEVRTVFMYRQTAAYDGDPNAIFISKTRPRHFFDKLRAAVGLARFLRSERFDAVLTYQHFGNVVGAVAARLAGVPLVIANQTGNPGRRGVRRVVTQIDRLFGRWGIYDFIVVNSGSTEAAYRTFSPRYSSRLIRIDHGIGMACTGRGKQQARDQFKLPHNTSLLVTTGRLAAGKNQDVLIRSLTLLKGVHLALAGSGPERQPFEALAQEIGVADRVHFVGELEPEQIPAFLHSANIFVFASTDETFGMSVVEAAAAGLPVASTDLPVLREVLMGREGKPAALFFRAGDHKALAELVGTLLKDDALAEELAVAGRSLAEKYSSDRMVSAYEQLIHHKAR